jgi:hypothetical protein
MKQVAPLRYEDCESVPKSDKTYAFGNEESMTYSVFFAVFSDLL